MYFIRLFHRSRINISQRFFLLVFFIIFTLFVLSSCSNKNEEYTGYYIFGIDTNETKVAFEKYTPASSDTEGLIEEFIDKMKKEPSDISIKKAIPDDVILDDYDVSESGELSLYFNSSYGNYKGVSEVLRRAAIVKTFCQIPEINGVQIYVAGQPLTNSNMEAVGMMTGDAFIDNTGGEGIYKQKTTLTMYFSNRAGSRLVEVPVDITYDASIPLEQLAIEQLIKGPKSINGIDDKKVLPTIPDGTRLNKVTIKEKTCYVDFSSEFLNKRKSITVDVAIYSVVNTLVELPTINRVQFSIDGEQVLTYNETVNFGETFERNLDLTEEVYLTE